MKREKKFYVNKWVFGGFKDKTKVFFIVPSIRVIVDTYDDLLVVTIGFGILFWEFVMSVNIYDYYETH